MWNLDSASVCSYQLVQYRAVLICGPYFIDYSQLFFRPSLLARQLRHGASFLNVQPRRRCQGNLTRHQSRVIIINIIIIIFLFKLCILEKNVYYYLFLYWFCTLLYMFVSELVFIRSTSPGKFLKLHILLDIKLLCFI